MESAIRTRERPTCPICNSTGSLLYSGLKDFCFSTSGEWNFRKCSGTDCGLVWIDPAPTEEDIGKAYQTYYTHNQPEPGAKLVRTISWAIWQSYLGARFGYRKGTGPKWLRIFTPLALLHPGGRDELDAAAMHLPAPNHQARLLEVGSGSGVSLARMQALGWEVEGVEVDPAAVKAAAERGVKVHLGDVAKQAFPEKSFDAIYSSHVIEHLHDPAAVLKECYRILKPGGKLVILTPNVESLGHRWYGSAWVGLDPPRHLSLFSRASLKRAAEQAGFAIHQLESSVRIAWVCGAMSYEIKRTGRCDVSHLNNPVASIRGFNYQMRERLAKHFDPLAGDELRLIGNKVRDQ